MLRQQIGALDQMARTLRGRARHGYVPATSPRTAFVFAYGEDDAKFKACGTSWEATPELARERWAGLLEYERQRGMSPPRLYEVTIHMVARRGREVALPQNVLSVREVEA